MFSKNGHEGPIKDISDLNDVEYNGLADPMYDENHPYFIHKDHPYESYQFLDDY